MSRLINVVIGSDGKMFGLSTTAIFTILKVGAVAAGIGALVHKGMMIERGRWERAVLTKNKEIAVLEKETTAKLAKAEGERDLAYLEAKTATDALLSNVLEQNKCVLPEDLIKKANRIR